MGPDGQHVVPRPSDDHDNCGETHASRDDLSAAIHSVRFGCMADGPEAGVVGTGMADIGGDRLHTRNSMRSADQ